MALALALSALVFASGAQAQPTTTYLALGDSLAFGYQQEKFEANFPNEAPAYFESGYPNYFAKKLKALITEENKSLVLVNNGCPGETTDSMIGNGALGKAVNPKTVENPFGESPACPYHFAQGLPLHNELATLSTLESGLSVLNPCFTKKSVCAPAHPVKAVTLNIGANDELRDLGKCVAKIKLEFEEVKKGEKAPPSWFPDAKLGIRECATETAVSFTFPHIKKNVETMLGLIRSASFGNYSGPVIFLGYYNAFSYILEGSDGLQKVLNQEMKPSVEAFGAKWVEPFPVFNPAPEKGKKEAVRIGCPGAPYTDKQKPAQDKFVCTTLTVGKYVNMGNINDIEANKAKKEASNKKEEEEGKEVIFPFGGEGDIHPTDLGYVQLGKLAFAQYP